MPQCCLDAEEQCILFIDADLTLDFVVVSLDVGLPLSGLEPRVDSCQHPAIKRQCAIWSRRNVPSASAHIGLFLVERECLRAHRRADISLLDQPIDRAGGEDLVVDTENHALIKFLAHIASTESIRTVYYGLVEEVGIYPCQCIELAEFPVKSITFYGWAELPTFGS